jgi:hypothetical protein
MNQRSVIPAHPSGNGQIAKPMLSVWPARLAKKPNEFLPRVNKLAVSARA